MSVAVHATKLRGIALATTVTLTAVAIGVGAAGSGASATRVASASSLSGPGSQPCGAATGEVVARTAGAAGIAIYNGELLGPRSRRDRIQVESDLALQAAAAGRSRVAVRAAVKRLVYSHTHIVRLRVTKGSIVMADVGGPYVLAPAGGTLRFRGRTVAHYLYSVQDDAGYAKLENRFVGYPVVFRRGSIGLPVEDSLFPGPARIPALGPVRFGRGAHEAFSFSATAFPHRSLRISLLMGVPRFLAKLTCSWVKTTEVARIAKHLADRFVALPPSVFLGVYVHLAADLTGALVLVRDGEQQLAGSAAGPATLPPSGYVSYLGSSYEVTSFPLPESPRLRVYTLVASR